MTPLCGLPSRTLNRGTVCEHALIGASESSPSWVEAPDMSRDALWKRLGNPTGGAAEGSLMPRLVWLGWVTLREVPPRGRLCPAFGGKHKRPLGCCFGRSYLTETVAPAASRVSL